MNRNKFLYYYLFIFIYSSISGQYSYNVDVMARISLNERCSSIWGYTDPDGVEYALLGTELGLRVFSLEDPRHPLELKFISAEPSIWREIKTNGPFAYVTTEATDGLMIVDLRTPKDSIPYRFVRHFTDAKGDSVLVHSAHTIFIDEEGLIYLAGAGPVGAGFALLEPGNNPWQPQFIMHYSDDYFHEVFATKNRLYSAELFNGVFGIWDTSDKLNLKRINDQQTAKTFSHSVWLETNRPVLYTTDETEAAYVESWDLSDEFNIKNLGRFRLPKKTDGHPIPHNVFYHDERLYVSYYTEGVRILDTKFPDKLIEVGWYDTHTQYESGFHGCWNVFPFFNSGICIASDIENGLFVLKYNGQRAGYVEVNIKDSRDSTPIHDARMTISRDTHSIESFSNIKGIVKSGFPEEDSVLIRVEKKGYFPLEFKTFITKNEILSFNLFMEELPQHQFRIHVIAQTNRKDIAHAKAALLNPDFRLTFQTDSTGIGQIDKVYQQNWDLVTGKWGYLQELRNDIELDRNLELEVELSKGYEDDFELDLGWTSSGDDPNVSWIQGDFSELSFAYSNFPIADLRDDIGTHALYTSNYENSDSAYSLKGELNLYSPWMDLSMYESIDIEYHAWAYGGYNSQKEIYLCSNDTCILLEAIRENLSGSFNPKSEIQLDLSGLKLDSAQLKIRLYNDPDSFYQAIRLFAAFDGFKLSGKKKSGTQEYIKTSIQIYPNPTHDLLYVELRETISPENTIEIYNSTGVKIKRIKIQGNQTQLDLRDWPPGYYFIGFGMKSGLAGFLHLPSK